MAEHDEAVKTAKDEAVPNGSWKTVRRVSHVAGWLAAAFFGGMQFTGWVHIQSADVQFQRVALAIEKNAKTIDKAVELIGRHDDKPAHREAALVQQSNRERIEKLEERLR